MALATLWTTGSGNLEKIRTRNHHSKNPIFCSCFAHSCSSLHNFTVNRHCLRHLHHLHSYRHVHSFPLSLPRSHSHIPLPLPIPPRFSQFPLLSIHCSLLLLPSEFLGSLHLRNLFDELFQAWYALLFFNRHLTKSKRHSCKKHVNTFKMDRKQNGLN